MKKNNDQSENRPQAGNLCHLGFIAAMPGMENQASAPADIPTAFQVFPYGEVHLQGERPIYVDDAAMNLVMQRFEARGIDMVIDYEHQTEGGQYASPDGKAPAAGWVKSLENRGVDGLWANVEWTEAARELLAKREYRYYSPVFFVSKEGRRLVELLRLALTNAPRLDWIRPIVANNTNLTQWGRPSSLPDRSQDMNLLILVAKQLGLPETSTQEEIMAKLADLNGASVPIACKEALDALGLSETASKSELVATIHALKQRPDYSQEIAGLKEKLVARDRDELVASALKAGKITPAQKEWADAYALSDPEGFRVFLAKAPQVVPTGTIDLAAAPKPKGDVPDDVQLQINKLCGVDEETWKKYNN
jgi:phage I-like protein